MTYLSRAFWSSLRARPSGPNVYRGYSAACAASGKEKDDASHDKRSRSSSRSRRGSTSSSRPAAPDGEKDEFLLKRTVSKDLTTVVGAVMEGIGEADKDIKGAEGVVDDMKEGLRDIKELGTAKQENGLSAGDRRALEEENAPLVSTVDVLRVSVG